MNNIKKYKIISSDITSPAFNLACEDFLLSEKSGEFLMLWRSSPSVIIGKNQNAYAEVNLQYVSDNKIPVIRRLTGGGAVFHDLGNINFSYIINSNSLIDLKSQLNKIIEFLKSLGLNAEFSGRNDIIADGYKVSGTAQVSKKGRSIVHGTLLYSADLSILSEILTPNPLKLEAKGISSVKSRVSNISALLNSEKTVDEFYAELHDFLLKNENCSEYVFSENDIDIIKKIQKEKYDSWDWNFGDAPKFTIEKSVLSKCGLLTANYTVKNGIIESIKFFGDYNSVGNIKELESIFVGLSINPQKLSDKISKINFEAYIQNSCVNDFLKLFK